MIVEANISVTFFGTFFLFVTLLPFADSSCCLILVDLQFEAQKFEIFNIFLALVLNLNQNFGCGSG